MPRKDIILWLDLETTGSSDQAAILEVGCIVTDQTPELNELSSFETIIQHPYREVGDPLNVEPWPEIESPVVLDMHRKNHLLEDLMVDKIAPDIRETEKMILRWLRGYGWDSGEHIPFAGSGVSHFDRKYIRRDWPMFDRLLTYWAYDVGSMRRMLRLAGFEFSIADQSGKPHRALADTRQHVEETRYYFNYLRDLRARANGESA